MVIDRTSPSYTIFEIFSELNDVLHQDKTSRRKKMKKLLPILLSVTLVISCGKDAPKVLLFITDGSRDLELMLTKEVLVMKEALEQSNFEVVITSISGELISVDSVLIEPDLKLSDVSIADYSGFIFPCMAPPWEKMNNLNPDVASFIEMISAEDKPMAAQTLSVADFANAGVLVDKEYAFTIEPDVKEYPDFKGGIYTGEGVIQDGNIITSGTCPWKARKYGVQDGTRQLTQLFIEAVRANAQ
jgi:putative intracellular protease/amidase